MNDRLLISEVFGPTVQGEGPSLGRPASFIRLGACNLSCTWCDTAYTWDRARYDLRQELTAVPAPHVLEQVLAHNTPLVVITGGEPLLQQHRFGWNVLLEGLLAAGRTVEVETNGTRLPTIAWTGVTFNVSPKLGHAGDPEQARLIPEVLHTFGVLAGSGLALFKFVATTADDVAEVDALVTRYDLPRDRVWVMPEGTTPEALVARTRAVTDAALTFGLGVTTRLHVLAWGTERGR